MMMLAPVKKTTGMRIRRMEFLIGHFPLAALCYPRVSSSLR
jgi:hypothetical protein